MPTETVIAISAICAIFVVFAIVLAYADFSTRKIHRP